MDALADHEVVKFIGRDCRALEAGYKMLLSFLCEGSEVYIRRLKEYHAGLIRRQEAADNALDDIEEQENSNDSHCGSNDGEFSDSQDIAAEGDRISNHRIAVENELSEVTAELLQASSGLQPPPMSEKVNRSV